MRDDGQLSFIDTSPPTRGDPLMHRRATTAPGDEIAVAHATPDFQRPKRDAALLKLREDLLDYVRELGVGAEFQSVDFTAWLEASGRLPDPSVLDLRVNGGLLVQLARHGLIEEVGFRSNGGDARRNHHACRRPVYAVRSLDAARLGWVESSAA